MLIAEYFGDPRPFRYRWSGDNTNLEMDWFVRSPREEFAVAGLLWDLHDGGSHEPKPVHKISSVIATTDDVSMSDADVFAVFANKRPTTLKALHDALMNPVDYPAYATTDGDGDGLPDVREIFVAHGVFDDVGASPDRPGTRDNRKWDGGDELVGFSGNGARPGRMKSPILPQAYLRMRLVDTYGRDVDVANAIMHIDMQFAPPFDYYDYQDTRPLGSSRVYFVMPPDFYPVRRSSPSTSLAWGRASR